MKSYWPAYLLFGWLVVVIGSGCTATTQLQVLQPADIGLPDHLNVIATMDRAKPAKGLNTVLEGLITGEDLGQDRRGRAAALDGVTNALTRTPRFTVKSTGIEAEGSNAGDRYALPLDWEEVDRLCAQYGADALLAIELFDTDNFVDTRRRERKKKDKNDNTIVEVYFDARMRVSVQIGWRLYDPKERAILDEFTVREDNEVDATGSTEDRAKGNLPARDRITGDVSFLAGERYGMRIAPVWINVQRSWYKKGKGATKEEMERATRYAQADQWDRAAEIWRVLATPAVDPKTAGRAAFNMAVANERAGKLQSGLDWAERSYADFGLKAARAYAQVLRERIYDQQRVEDQLSTDPGGN